MKIKHRCTKFPQSINRSMQFDIYSNTRNLSQCLSTSRKKVSYWLKSAKNLILKKI